MDEQTQRRVSRAAETILGNESLTADLDDDAAQILLDWGVDQAKMIAQATEGLNEAEADEAISSSLRELRRLMRAVNRWVAGSEVGQDDESRTSALTTIVEQAALVYENFTTPTAEEQDQFQQQQFELNAPAPQMIANLRWWLEEKTTGFTTKTTTGEDNDQEEN